MLFVFLETRSGLEGSRNFSRAVRIVHATAICRAKINLFLFNLNPKESSSIVFVSHHFRRLNINFRAFRISGISSHILGIRLWTISWINLVWTCEHGRGFSSRMPQYQSMPGNLYQSPSAFGIRPLPLRICYALHCRCHSGYKLVHCRGTVAQTSEDTNKHCFVGHGRHGVTYRTILLTVAALLLHFRR